MSNDVVPLPDPSGDASGRPCSTCGHTLPRDAPGGLCPCCLRREFLCAEPEPAAVPPPGAGNRFGDYELLGEIARGGMGIVYRARQRGLGRLVALKLIESRQESSPECVARFETEARAAASLDHPNVVPIYEVGEHDGRHFLAMKLVEGPSLAQRLADRQAPLAPRQAAKLLATLARAVHHAHQRGVLHRDLKPSNILLDARGEPHLTDFGLARLLEGQSTVTQPGAAVGTPAYMSPKQAAGGTAQLTTASDIFSLGAILYEMLSGRPPFLGASPLETMRKVVEEQAVPPSMVLRKTPSEAREPRAEANPNLDSRMPQTRRGNRDVPTPSDGGLLSSFGVRLSDVEVICLKCLAKEPEARYPTALALAEDLERWLSGETILARPSGTTRRLWRWARRNRTVAVLGVLLTLLVLGVVIGSSLAALRIRAAHDESVRRLVRLHANEATSRVRRGEDLLAIPHLLAALRSARDPWEAELLRMRLGSTLAAVPQPVAMWFLDAMITDLAVGPGGVVAAGTGAGAVWRWHPAPAGKGTEAVELLHAPGEIANRFGDAPVFDFIAVRSLAPPNRFRPAIESVAFSPDGLRVAAAGRDGAARIWSIGPGETAPVVLSHDHFVYQVAFSADSAWLATASADGSARVWDAATGRPVTPALRRHAGVTRVAFSPDKRFVAAGHANGEVAAWDLSRASVRWSTKPYDNPVTAVEFSPAGARLLATFLNRNVLLWDFAGQVLLPPEKHHANAVGYAAFSRDGRQMVTCSFDQTARLWDVARGISPVPSLRHAFAVYHASFSPDGARVVTASGDGTARLWRTDTGKAFGSVLPHCGRVLRAVFGPDGHSVFTAGVDQAVRQWLLPAAPNFLAPLPGSQPGTRVIFPERDRGHCLVERKGRWQFCDALTGQGRGPDFAPAGGVAANSSCDEHRALLVNQTRAGVQIWDVKTGRPLGPEHHQTSPVMVARLHPAGRSFFVVCEARANVLEHRDAVTGQTLGAALTFGGPVQRVEIPTAGHRLLVAWEQTVELIELGSGTRRVRLEHPSRASVARFSGDGRFVLTACTDATLEARWARVWSATTGRPVTPPLRHRDGVVAAVFSPDGRRVLTTGEDGVARLWNAATGEPLSPELVHPTAPLLDSAVSPDGRLVASLASDSTFQVWDADTAQPLGGPVRVPRDWRSLFWVDNRQIVFQTPDFEAWRWVIPRADASPDQLEALSTVLTAHRIEPSGSLVPVEPAELKRAWQKYQSGAPARGE